MGIEDKPTTPQKDGITVIESVVTGIEMTDTRHPHRQKDVGILVRLPHNIDLKAMLAKGPLFIRKPQFSPED